MMGRTMFTPSMANLAALLLLVYPSLMLTVRGGMNGVFILALLMALLAWPFGKYREDGLFGRRDIHLYVLAMFGLTIAIFFSESYWQHYSGRSYDAASRYWLSIPIFLWLSCMESRVFRSLQIAFPVAAISGFLLTDEMWGRSGIGTLDLIHFGDMALILGVMSLFSVDWFGRDNAVLRTLKIVGFIAGVAASFGSGSRGGWLAIPVFIVIFLFFHRHRIPLRAMAGIVALSLSSMAALYAFNGTINQRMNALAHDIRHYQTGNRDTSIGIRWQLYTAAIDIISRHPVVGVGPTGFAREMQPMMEAGKLTPEAANLGHGEVHNDVLSKTVGMGIFGLGAILLIYIVPFRMFWRASKSNMREVRRTGILGVTFVSGIGIFGLTVEFLNLTMAAAFYAFTVAVLLAACQGIQQGTPDSNIYDKDNV
jgi:O-antigen ligase